MRLMEHTVPAVRATFGEGLLGQFGIKINQG